MGQLSETVMWWRSWCCHWREAGLSQSSWRCITGDEGLEVVGGHLLELLRTYRENRWGRPRPLVSSYRAHWVLQNYWWGLKNGWPPFFLFTKTRWKKWRVEAEFGWTWLQTQMKKYLVLRVSEVKSDEVGPGEEHNHQCWQNFSLCWVDLFQIVDTGYEKVPWDSPNTTVTLPMPSSPSTAPGCPCHNFSLLVLREEDA